MAEKVEKKAPPKKAAKKTSRKYKLYQVSGDALKRKNKSCPKCGTGVFLGTHRNRLYCGTCHYTEFLKQ